MNDTIITQLVGKITLMFPELTVDLQKQLELRMNIEEVLCNYDINSKRKEITRSDIEEKAKLFLECRRQEGCSKNTIEWYTYLFKEMIPYFNKPCTMITTSDLRLFLANLNDGNRSNSTINSYITRTRVFFNWLLEEGYILKNPAARIKKVKVSKVIKRPYSEITVEKLRNACETIRDKALFEIMESTGCRIGEIETMKVKDIDFQEQSIIVTGKGRKERIVYFSSRAKLFLEEYLSQRKGDSEYIFLSLKSPYKPLGDRGICFMLNRLKKRAGVNERVFSHRFRRTKATGLLNSGMSLQGVQQFLGHANPSTTEIYATISQENLKNEYKRLTR